MLCAPQVNSWLTPVQSAGLEAFQLFGGVRDAIVEQLGSVVQLRPGSGLELGSLNPPTTLGIVEHTYTGAVMSGRPWSLVAFASLLATLWACGSPPRCNAIEVGSAASDLSPTSCATPFHDVPPECYAEGGMEWYCVESEAPYSCDNGGWDCKVAVDLKTETVVCVDLGAYGCYD